MSQVSLEEKRKKSALRTKLWRRKLKKENPEKYKMMTISSIKKRKESFDNKPELRDNFNKLRRKKYQTDDERRNQILLKSKIQYATSQEKREKVRLASLKRYNRLMSDPIKRKEINERRKIRNKIRNRTDPNFVKRRRACVKKFRINNPLSVKESKKMTYEKIKERMLKDTKFNNYQKLLKKRSYERNKEKRLKREYERYHNDPILRKKISDRQKDRRKNDAEFRKHKSEMSKIWHRLHPDLSRAHSRKRYHKFIEYMRKKGQKYYT